MRAPALLIFCALTTVTAACGTGTRTSTSPGSTMATTTTADPVDRPAVDAIVDRLVPALKPVLKAESGEVGAKDLTQGATDLMAIADELKDPAKRPAGVPAEVSDELTGALAGLSAATSDLARSYSSCPAGISTPRCTELYLKLNEAQTAVNGAIRKFAGFGSRSEQDVQNRIYTS